MHTATRNLTKIGVGLFVGAFFLWLALRSVDLDEVARLWGTVRFFWLWYFVPVVILSLWIRMERWKMLIEHDGIRCGRAMLFAGIMNGNAINYAVPRLGEITRCYYVAKNTQRPVSVIVGTVVLERLMDVAVMVLLLVLVFFFVVSDPQALAGLLGFDESASTVDLYTKLGIYALAGLVAAACAWFLLRWAGSRFPAAGAFRERLRIAFGHFGQGVLSVRRIAQPGRFIGLTIALWVCYVLMAGIPFAIIEGSPLADLGMVEALVITVISAVGVTIPSPGGVGTYHLLVQKALFVLYMIPEATGFTYALVSHGVVMVITLMVTPVALWVASSWKKKV